jgi:hypothetical protein
VEFDATGRRLATVETVWFAGDVVYTFAHRRWLDLLDGPALRAGEVSQTEPGSKIAIVRWQREARGRAG